MYVESKELRGIGRGRREGWGDEFAECSREDVESEGECDNVAIGGGLGA